MGHDCHNESSPKMMWVRNDVRGAIAVDVGEFDARPGTPGLHRVRSHVLRVERRTILPPVLWQRDEGAGIWRHPDFDTRSVALAEARRPVPALS